MNADAIERRILRDPGERKVAAFARSGELERAARALFEDAGPALILTGFPVLRADGSGSEPETDGPGGAKALGDALRALGRAVSYACGPNTAELLVALGEERENLCVASELEPGGPRTRELAARLLDAVGATDVVAVEVPGRASDGRYYGMSGRDLSASVCALDELLLVASAEGRRTVGVGDGGNEAGMGSLRQAVVAGVPKGETIASVVPADCAVVAGTSTWGALGLVAALSDLAGRDLLPSDAAFSAGLDAIVALGAVDGMSGRAEATIDGLPLSETLTLLRDLRA